MATRLFMPFRLLARVPVIFAVQALGLGIAVAAVVALDAAPASVDRVTLAAAPLGIEQQQVLPSWDAEVAAFAQRLADAFELEPARAHQFSGWILEAAARQSLPPELVASLIAIESEFRLDARSAFGAIGPAQVVPRYWTGFCGGADLQLPEENVYCGAQILAHYMERCGNFTCALEMYNVGPKNARKAAYAGARERYIAKVNRSLDRFVGLQTRVL